ncbi:cytochrome c [uncultured Dokdonia sp.]|uniref:c-type cytochrome n=1 Tax=uncultured Dokdonia sp. TaxID=575653 RepID=UPI002629B033|nr:cytochrome c [uncultured Dokdonia sp.]
MKKLLIISTIGCLLMGFTLQNESSVYTTAQDPLKESIERGAEVYTEYCVQCHLGKGEGIPKIFPPLAKSDWLTKDNITNAIRVVKYGQTGKITVNGEPYNGVMAELGLYEDEVADVMNYIMNSWGNSYDTMITEAQVKKVTKE